MGQRLVINVYQNHDSKEILCNCYYHWSAYTIPAIETAENFINAYMNLEDKCYDSLLRCIRAFESFGGRVELEYIEDTYKLKPQSKSENYKFLKKKYPKEKFSSKGLDRNEGIICIVNPDSNINASEYMLDLYLDEQEMTFGVFNSWCDDIGDYLDCCVRDNDNDDIDVDSLTMLDLGLDMLFDYDIEYCSWNDIDKFKSLWQDIQDNNEVIVNDEIVSSIY